MRAITALSRIGTAGAVAGAVGLVSLAALAVNPDTTTMPNGAELSVQIDDPTQDEEFKVPAALGPGGTIDVPIDAQASIGQGEPNIHITFVLDVSGSTDFFECAGGVILDCEQDAVANVVNDPNFISVLDVGLAVFADSGASADMSADAGQQDLTSIGADVITVANSTFSDAGGGDGGVTQFTLKNVGQFTNYTAGLTAANNSVSASAAATKRVFFLSDGLPNPAGSLAAFDAAVAALGAQIDSFALGDPADVTCGDPNEVSLQRMADMTGGQCIELADPAAIITELPNLIATELLSAEIGVNGGALPTTCAPMLPQPGPVTTFCDATALGLPVGDHNVTATAVGDDSAPGMETVIADVDIHLLQLTAAPETDDNDLNLVTSHTVTAEILGGSGPARNIDFLVGGQNAATATPSFGVEIAAPNEEVSFSYSVPQVCESLGTDTITVSTVIAGMEDTLVLEKTWFDATPPEVSCDPSVNPHGLEPQAPGTGQNEDGFYQLNSEDPTLGCEVTLTVMDGDGFVFPGPFAPGDVIKYTQDDTLPQEQKKIGSGQGQAGETRWHLIGHGDLTVVATDTSGNAATAQCLVPPPPK